jgi:hypothetical protein
MGYCDIFKRPGHCPGDLRITPDPPQIRPQSRGTAQILFSGEAAQKKLCIHDTDCSIADGIWPMILRISTRPMMDAA